MKIVKTIVIVIAVLVFIGFLAEIFEGEKKSSTVPTTQTVAKATEPKKVVDQELQKKRLEWIQKLGEQGYAEKIQIENGVGKLWVTSKFLMLSEIDINKTLEVPYAYVMDELGTDVLSTPFILKVDNGTPLGKRVGEYNPTKGVKFYK